MNILTSTFLKQYSLIIFWMIGIVACFLYYVLISKKFNISRLLGLVFSFVILLAEIIGAKLLFILERIPNVTINDLTALGGFSLFGVFLFSPFIIFLVCKFLKFDFITFMDFMSVGILIELAFYRVGCYVGGCCGGINISTGTSSFVFPVQIVEIGLDIALSAILIIFFLRNKLKKGQLFYLTYAGYGIIRFILEFLRVRNNLFLVFSLSHIFALMIIIFGVIGFLHTKNIINSKKK